MSCFFFFQAEDGIRDKLVTGVQTCALPISVVALERRTQVLDELAAHAPERLDLAPDLRLLAARSLYDLLAPQLGLPHVELRLAPGRGLHLVAEPLRRHERVLEGPLALGEDRKSVV